MEPQTLFVGQQAYISCRAISGIPTPTIEWSRRNGRPLPRHASQDYPETLMFNQLTLDDSGEYECKATNLAGSVSVTASISVQEPPTISINPNVTELVLTEGDELKLECNAHGSPQPGVEWKHPNQEETRHMIRPQLAARNVPAFAIVQKYNVRKSDEGIYSCMARNAAGTEEQYIRVLVQSKRGDVGKRYDSMFFFLPFETFVNNP